MLLERIYDTDLAQASYLIGCQKSGEAIVIDPRRDIDVYVARAESHGMRVIAVTETHIHADYLSGTLELAAATGAVVYVSDEGGPDWTYGSAFDDAIRMKDGQEIRLGNVTLAAAHTPGHTPEHLSFLVTDGAQADEPGFMLTGDFVFVGDVGRPDLLDEAAGGEDTRFLGARDLYASLRDRFLTLPDYVQVLPAHGAGSACGKALGAIPTSTVGYERAFSWWSGYVRDGDEQGFVDELLGGQPDAHAYFARMKRQNKFGPALLGTPAALIEQTSQELARAIECEEIVLMDARPNAQVHQGTVLGALNVPGVGRAASYGAWVIDPERDTRPIVLLAADRDEAEDLRDHLVRVGIDTVAGYVTSLRGLNVVAPTVVSPEALSELGDVMLLDVRNKTEFADGHLPGAEQLNGGRAIWALDRLPKDRLIVTYCQSGVRSSVTASALRSHGFQVAELEGSYQGWASMPGNVPVVGHPGSS